MNADVDLYGVFVPALGLIMLATYLVSVPLRALLVRAGVYRLVWHRPLFDLALYVVLLGAVVALLSRHLP